MDRSDFDALTSADAHARAEHERDELRQSLWLHLAREIGTHGADTAADLPADIADHYYEATAAQFHDDSHA